MTVLVGYDGTPHSRGALLLASGEAARRRRGLRVLHVSRAGRASAAVLAEAADVLASGGSAVATTYESVPGDPARDLVARSTSAGVVVVGRGGRGLNGVLPGSVTIFLARTARCPVLVVPDDGRHRLPARGDVVVGVDPADGHGPLDAAFEAAYARHVGLTAVHAVGGPVEGGLMVDAWAEGGLAPAVTAAAGLLHDTVHAVHARYPSVPVTEVVEHGRPAQVLLDVAAGAGVVVVGRHGNRIVGSTTAAMLRHSHHPVLVAPAERAAYLPAGLLVGGP
jgi:nucleotide-binding universal stress UspA family protein